MGVKSFNASTNVICTWSCIFESIIGIYDGQSNVEFKYWQFRLPLQSLQHLFKRLACYVPDNWLFLCQRIPNKRHESKGRIIVKWSVRWQLEEVRISGEHISIEQG